MMDKEIWKYKILQTVAVLIIGTLTTISLVILQILAVNGGSLFEPQENSIGFLPLWMYGLSAVWLHFISIVGTISLVASIWWEEFTNGMAWLWLKTKVVIRGASKELKVKEES
jgi:hypothetical protein